MLPLTPEKEANRWKIAKKRLSLRLFVAMATVYNILIKKKENEKEIPGVLLIFTVNARSLNPKLKQIVHF